MSEAMLAVVAATQAGAFSLTQAAAAGITPSVCRHNLDVGRWVRLRRGVMAIAGSTATPERRLWAAALALGANAAVSHRSALWSWQISGSRVLELVEFSVPLAHRGTRQGIVVHRSGDLVNASLSTCRGLVVTNPLRTLVDIGAVLPAAAVEDAVDRAVSRKLVTPPALLAEVRRLSCRGRSGVGVLRDLLLEQGVGGARSPSYLEAKALRLFRHAGLGTPVVELRWGSHGQFRLDFIWPEHALVVEVDGWDCHSSPTSRQYDLHRRNQIVLGDLRPLVYTYGDIVRRGDRVVAEILRAVRVS